MSRVTFTSLSGDVDLCGRERAHAAIAVEDMVSGALGSEHLALVPADSYVHKTRNPLNSLRVWWQVDGGKLAITADDLPCPVRAWDVTLNTAIAEGPDPIRFFARMHATCEIHGYVEGPNRAWLADIIDQGLTVGLYRTDALREWGRWQGVTELLRSRDDEPVVMYYSVTRGFPDPHVLGIIRYEDEEGNPLDDGPQWDRWEALGHAEQWRLGMDWLRARNPTCQVDLDPETFRTRMFGAEWTIHDVNDWLDSRNHKEGNPP